MECLMDPIPHIIYNCLSNFCYNDAIFLSERFHSELQGEESLYLLALCYYRAHKVLRAYHLLRNKSLKLPQSKYLLSKCCIDLNRRVSHKQSSKECIFRYGEAEAILTECTLSKQKLFEEIVREYGDYSCYVLQILALVYSKTDRIPQSIEFHKKCLRLNPFLWSSFEALCNFGERIDPAKYFTSSSALNLFNTQFKRANSYSANVSQKDFGKAINHLQDHNFSLNDLFTMKENSLNEQDEQCNSSNNTSIGSTNSLNNITLNNLQHSVTEIQNETTYSSESSKYYEDEHPLATPPQLISSAVNKIPFPTKKCVSKRLPIKPLCGQNNNGNLANIALSNPQTVRRSSRIFAQSANAVKENKKLPSSTTSKHTCIVANSSMNKDDMNHKLGNKKLKVKKKMEIAGLQDSILPASSNQNSIKPIGNLNTSSNLKNDTDNNRTSLLGYEECFCLDRISKMFDPTDETQKNKIENIMKILRDFGNGYLNLTQYELNKALEHFESLPIAHFQSSYILSAVGKAFFELHDYQKAEKIYLKLRQLHPYHLEGLEYYSTVLWHLQKEIILSSLSQELTEYDKLAPETWCVVGNCFSLHKEHDAAIKFFQRATQINSEFVYAYNLLGHEYFLIEEMEKGLSCFRKAIFLDPRHYNAWYGISMINLKQEKFVLAEKYLKRALIINPHSSTLMCHIAVVYHSMKKSDKALEILDRALELDPKNFLCKFHRASILFSMEKYELALVDFEKLRRQIPKESLIYYMISKTHKKLRNIQLSLMFMSWAMDLDPKGVNNQLKESIDKRYVVDNDSTFARELESINTLSLDSIYGSEGDNNNAWNNPYESAQEIEINSNANILPNNNDNNSDSIENDDEPCPSVFVNTLSNLLSTHHISGAPKTLLDKLDTTLTSSTASTSASTMQPTELLKNEPKSNDQDVAENSNFPLEASSVQTEEQLMDLTPESED